MPTTPQPENHLRSSSPHLRPSALPETKRGGPRPGAGAPKGNMNALKHGRRSRQLVEIAEVLASSPEIQRTLLNAVARNERKKQTDTQVAVALLTRIYNHARDIAQGKPSRGLFAALRKQSELNARPQSAFDTQSTATEAELATALHEINAEITKMKKITAQQSNSPQSIIFQIRNDP